MLRVGLEEAVEGAEEEVAGADRGLEEAEAVERAIGGVAGERQDRVDDLRAGEDRAAGRVSLAGEVRERVADRRGAGAGDLGFGASPHGAWRW